MKYGSKAAIHRRNRLLAALEPEDYLWLEPHLEIVDLPRGRVIYEAGEKIRHTYFPHEAIVSLVNVLQNGGSVQMAIFGREAAFGYIGTVLTRQSFGRYVTQIPGTASRIRLDSLTLAFSERPKIRDIVFRYTEALLAQTLQSVACNAVHSVESRCCSSILSACDRTGTDEIPLTHEALAEMLGVQRSTVSSVTSALQKAGLIMQGRGTIRIVDRAGLEATACECYEIVRQSFERILPGASRRR